MEGGCFSANIASRRVMEKSGMKYEGCIREMFIKNGEYHDSLMFGALKREWMTEKALEFPIKLL